MPPIVDPTKCKACGRCVDICSEDVFYGSKKKEIPVVRYPEECWHCHACVLECPVEGAIRIRVPLPMLICYKKSS